MGSSKALLVLLCLGVNVLGRTRGNTHSSSQAGLVSNDNEEETVEQKNVAKNLEFAATYGFLEDIIRFLPKATLTARGSALNIAVINGHIRVVEYLVYHNEVTKFQRTVAMKHALREKEYECVVALAGYDMMDITFGAQVPGSEQVVQGCTLLHVMSCLGENAILTELISRGANQDIKNAHGQDYNDYGFKCLQARRAESRI